MNRLTERIEDNVYYTKGKYSPATLCAEMETWEVRECMKKLAAYEDTGLEPEDVKAIYAASSNIIKFVMDKKELVDKLQKELEEYKNARTIIKLPCRDNETVYCIDCDEVCEFFVSEVSLHYGHKDGVKFNGILDNEFDYEFNLSDFGKTVFLTREEAEKALGKME